MAINASGSQIAGNYTKFPNITDFMDNPNGSDYYNQDEQYAFKNPFEIIYLIICILGLTANALSMTATALIPHGLTTHSKLIISLCASDSLVLVAALLHFFTYSNSSWVFCFYIINRVLQDTAVLATLLNLLAMASDHYLAVIKPLCYRRFMTNFCCTCLIASLWILSLFVSLLEVIVGRLTTTNMDVPFCVKISLDEYDSELIMTIIIFIVLFGVVIFYTRIYFVVKDIIKQDQLLYQDEQHNYKATITTMLFIGSFILLWTPLAIFKIYTSLWAYASNHEELRHANDFLFSLLLLNSLVDPLLYAIRLHKVQKGYKILLYKLFPNRRFSINEEEFRNQHFSSCSRRRDTVPTIVHDNTSIPSPDGDNAFECNMKSEGSSFIFYNHSERKKESHIDDLL